LYLPGGKLQAYGAHVLFFDVVRHALQVIAHGTANRPAHERREHRNQATFWLKRHLKHDLCSSIHRFEIESHGLKGRLVVGGHHEAMRGLKLGDLMHGGRRALGISRNHPPPHACALSVVRLKLEEQSLEHHPAQAFPIREGGKSHVYRGFHGGRDRDRRSHFNPDLT